MSVDELSWNRNKYSRIAIEHILDHDNEVIRFKNAWSTGYKARMKMLRVQDLTNLQTSDIMDLVRLRMNKKKFG